MARRMRLLAALPALLAFVGTGTVSAGESRKLPRVLLIGDSICSGYCRGVAKALAGKAEVVKNSGNAQHTWTGVRRIDGWLGKAKWDVIHFNWGLWDLARRNPKSRNFGHLDKVNGKLTTSLAQYEKNLRAIVARLGKTDATLIWASTTPVPDGEPGRIQGDAKKYNAVAAAIMKANGIAVNDLHAHVLPRLNELQGKANVHFKEKGNMVLAKKVADCILAALAGEVSGRGPAGHRAEWLHEARWGVMTHYLGAAPSSRGGAELTAKMWNKRIDAFDAAGLADQVASTGAKYLLFTIGQNSGHYCSPNAAYDKIVGIRPTKCSRRDLVAELANALKKRGLRLMVYLPSGAPAADPVARKKLKWRWGRKGGWQLPGEKVGGRLAEFQKNWEAIVRQWSLRWGKDVAGWWIDGTYFPEQMYRFTDPPNFASLAGALRAGNPDAIVAFNPGIRVPVIVHTRHEDYTAGEAALRQVPKAVAACPGRFLTRKGAKVQFQILTFLGKSWCRGESPQWPDEKVIPLVRQLAAKGGAITFDVPITKTGVIPEQFIKQLKAIGRGLPAGKSAAKPEKDKK